MHIDGDTMADGFVHTDVPRMPHGAHEDDHECHFRLLMAVACRPRGHALAVTVIAMNYRFKERQVPPREATVPQQGPDTYHNHMIYSSGSGSGSSTTDDGASVTALVT